MNEFQRELDRTKAEILKRRDEVGEDGKPGKATKGQERARTETQRSTAEMLAAQKNHVERQRVVRTAFPAWRKHPLKFSLSRVCDTFSLNLVTNCWPVTLSISNANWKSHRSYFLRHRSLHNFMASEEVVKVRGASVWIKRGFDFFIHSKMSRRI